MLEQLAINLAGSVRRETMDGRDYLVAPLTMIVPGVLNGSKGPLYYPLDEISKNYDAWNGMPIVIDHPMKDGIPTSARNPGVLKKSGVGQVFNAKVDGKLVAEGWFDEQRLQKLSPSSYEKLISGKPEELSTGLFTDNIPVKNGLAPSGEAYVAVATNYRPDHLAILPGKRGACSVKDGCGVNINQAAEPTPEQLARFIDWDNPVVENAGKEHCGCPDVVCECDDCQAERAKKQTQNQKAWFELVPAEQAPQWFELVSPTINQAPSNSLEMSPDKACQILKDGTVHGQKLTKKQRGLFGVRCGQRTDNSIPLWAQLATPSVNAKKSSGPNCGTGAGGFKDGNSCAKKKGGKSSAGQAGSSEGSETTSKTLRGLKPGDVVDHPTHGKQTVAYKTRLDGEYTDVVFKSGKRSTHKSTDEFSVVDEDKQLKKAAARQGKVDKAASDQEKASKAKQPRNALGVGQRASAEDAGKLLDEHKVLRLQKTNKDGSVTRLVIKKEGSSLNADIYHEEKNEVGFTKSEGYYVGSARKLKGADGVKESLSVTGYDGDKAADWDLLHPGDTDKWSSAKKVSLGWGEDKAQQVLPKSKGKASAAKAEAAKKVGG